mgnify:FL=1
MLLGGGFCTECEETVEWKKRGSLSEYSRTYVSKAQMSGLLYARRSMRRRVSRYCSILFESPLTIHVGCVGTLLKPLLGLETLRNGDVIALGMINQVGGGGGRDYRNVAHHSIRHREWLCLQP